MLIYLGHPGACRRPLVWSAGVVHCPLVKTPFCSYSTCFLGFVVLIGRLKKIGVIIYGLKRRSLEL